MKVMADRASINISRIPKCVRLSSGASLRDVVHTMDRAADGGTSDGYFTAENFSYIRKRTDLRHIFRTFGQFKSYISQYIRSKACDPACRGKDDVPFDIRPREICLAPPPPKLPPPLSEPEQIKPPPDLSDLADEYPPWFDQPPKSKPQRDPPVVHKHPPPIKDKIAKRLPFPSLDWIDDRIDREHPGIPGLVKAGPEARFDGEYFILNFRGCERLYREGPCIFAWPYYEVILNNHNTNRRSTKLADGLGKCQVKIRAREGNEISAYGVDSDGSYSWEKFIYRIQKGKVWLARRINW